MAAAVITGDIRTAALDDMGRANHRVRATSITRWWRLGDWARDGVVPGVGSVADLIVSGKGGLVLRMTLRTMGPGPHWAARTEHRITTRIDGQAPP